jgi:anti-sigma factor RsiW
MQITVPRFWRRRAPLSCRELVELVTDYFEGALSGADRRRFDTHIAGCDGCTTYVAELRAVHEQAGRLAVNDISPEAEAKLREAFSAWREP